MKLNVRTGFLFGFFIILHTLIYAQQELEEVEKDLSYFCDVMVNAAETRHRAMAGKAFEEKFLKVLSFGSSFSYSFDSLKWISKKYPEDRSFRLFTWELSLGKSDHRYYGILQLSDGRIFTLHDHFKEAEDITESEFGADQWLGAIYYNLLEFKDSGGAPYYMLFGLNRWSRFEHIKLVDVLFFTKEGVPYFGKPIFKQTDKDGNAKFSHRIVFRYASDAQFTLNYNPGMGMIMFDHLVRRMSRIEGQGETMIPDGTYMGFEKSDNYWNWIEKIATQTVEEPPRPKPILDERKGKKIFGNQ